MIKRTHIFLNGRFLTMPLTGVQRTAFELVTALDQLIEENTINREQYAFTLIYSGELINLIQLKHIRLSQKGRLKGNLWEQLELPMYTAGHLLINMCTIAPLSKRKQMVIVHDASFEVNPQYFSTGFRTWYKFAIPALAKLSRHMLTVSEFSKQELIKFCGFQPDKTSVIYNAANHILKYDEPSQEFKNKINHLKPYCLAVSSLGANKNFKGLSEAISKIDFSKYNMLIAGGVIGALKQATSQGQAVTYLGYVSNAELKYLYSNASLFVFPSFYEGFGIPPLEAMMLGCPVAASNTSSLPEILGDACAYFNPADTNSMAHTIHSLLSDETKLASLRAKGYEQVKKYSWTKSAWQLQQLIEQYSA
jgi:glycosyltransferase involved in cell wall biosynthesis